MPHSQTLTLKRIALYSLPRMNRSNAEEQLLLVVLKELKTATTIICDQKSPSVSMILPDLLKLKKSLRVSESDSTLVKAVKTAAIENLDTRYLDDNLNLHLVVCTLLDPRYKDMIIDENIKTAAINSLIEFAIGIQHEIDVQSVPVKSEPATAPETIP